MIPASGPSSCRDVQIDSSVCWLNRHALSHGTPHPQATTHDCLAALHVSPITIQPSSNTTKMSHPRPISPPATKYSQLHKITQRRGSHTHPHVFPNSPTHPRFYPIHDQSSEHPRRAPPAWRSYPIRRMKALSHCPASSPTQRHIMQSSRGIQQRALDTHTPPPLHPILRRHPALSGVSASESAASRMR